MLHLLAVFTLILCAYAVIEDTGVVITLNYPRDDEEVSCPFAPQLNLALGGSGPLVDRIKYTPSEVSYRRVGYLAANRILTSFLLVCSVACDVVCSGPFALQSTTELLLAHL